MDKREDGAAQDQSPIFPVRFPQGIQYMPGNGKESIGEADLKSLRDILYLAFNRDETLFLSDPPQIPIAHSY